MEHFKFGFEHEALIHIDQDNVIDNFVAIADQWRLDEEREHPYGTYLRASLQKTLKDVRRVNNQNAGGTRGMQSIVEKMEINTTNGSQNSHFNERRGPASQLNEQFWHDPITDCTYLPLRDTPAMMRYFMASIFNYVGPNNFKVTQYYHGRPCSPRALLPHKKPSDAPFYTVTEDGSVKLAPDTDPVLFYREFEDVILNRQPMHPPYKIIQGVEMSSRILTIEDVDPSTSTTFDAFLTSNTTAHNAFSFWHNRTTSNHVHFSYHDATYYRNPVTLAKICMVYWYFEPVLLLLVGHWRRRNTYADSMRNQLKTFKHYRNLFFGVDHSNFEQFLATHGLSLDLPSIVFMFQTDRYSAFNMYNLAPKSIGTIEVRLKHGSNDPLENKMWMLLLAFMFKAAADDKMWITNQSNEFKKSAWDLYAKLETNSQWDSSTKLFLNEATLNDLKVVLDVMKTYVGEDIVWNYWMSVLARLHDVPATIVGGGSSRRKKGSGKQSGKQSGTTQKTKHPRRKPSNT